MNEPMLDLPLYSICEETRYVFSSTVKLDADSIEHAKDLLRRRAALTGKVIDEHDWTVTEFAVGGHTLSQIPFTPIGKD